LTLAVVPLLIDCGAGKGLPGMPSMPGACPADVADADAVMKANFGLEGELEGKVKAALAAGANLQALAGEIEGEVSGACGKLAKDLGASDADIKPKEDGPGKKAQAACDAAIKALGDAKAKAKATLKVDVVPPKCSVDDRNGRLRGEV